MTAAQHPWRSRITATLGLLTITLALLLGPASPASAHAVLVSSSPPEGAVVAAAPTEVVLTFSESVRKVPGKMRVIGPDGSRVDRGEPTFDGAVVTIKVDPGGPRGTYLVSYRVISADSHPVAGGYTYSVGAPSAAPSDSEGASRVDPVVSAAVKVAEYLGYAGLVLLIGPVLVLSLLWPRRLSRRGPARLVWSGVGLVTVATLAALWLQMPYTNGGGLFAVTGSELGDVLGSTFGVVHLVRLGMLAAAAIVLRPLLAGRAGRIDQVLLVVLAVCGLATWPLGAHPAASPVPAVSVVADMVHVASMAVWLGGLIMLVAFLLRQADDRELGAILPIWSRWAALAVTALLLAGTVQALIEVGTVSALVSTMYGRLVLIKIVLFALVIAVAAVSRQFVRRRVADAAEPDVTAGGSPVQAVVGAVGPGRPTALRRAVLLELAVTAVVLGLSATLVQTTPARTAVGTQAGGGVGYYSATLTSNLYALQVEVDPARTGNNTIHLYAYTPDNKPLPVVEWKASVALPDKGVEAVDVPLLPITDNHATGDLSLPTPGRWQLRITVRISEIDQATVTATVPIT